MKKLLPLVLLLIGVGAGVGAGVFLRPVPNIEIASASEEGEHPEEDQADDHDGDHNEDAKDEEGDDHADGEAANEYVKLRNQFVVPIVMNEKVSALVVLALSIEVPAGKTDMVYLREPKLRDSFLQVLFDHANIGGFEGNFTDALMLDRLRTALREVAQKDLGKDVGKDVLIIEIARQDY